MAGRVHLFVTLKPRPGREGGLDALLRGMCGPSRAEAGCLRYDLFAPAEGGGARHLIECWRDQAALDAHREELHYKDFRSRVGDLVEGAPAVLFLREVDAAS
ncbi:MAG: antibiotic biosynthesis monooxygenase [Candidatus Tectomicrobia bacterium]|uniref:Antibiotic biosynthesis monooxygenase n=1 Tax=Tectimicrobiota bacterium TaxID=2528274 RepID=A0A932MNA0_UNCTE|nr:antibiotic biosynthesis monooxygenase [Candidatus Tectomicrobia bacterium]